MRKFPRPTVLLAAIALVAAFAGTAIAGSSVTAAKKSKHADASADAKQVKTLLAASTPKAYRAYAKSSPAGSNKASVTVPAGDYVAVGACTAVNGPNHTNDGSATSALASTGDSTHNVLSSASVPHDGYHDGFTNQTYGNATLSNTTVFHLPQGGTITETCADALGLTQQTLHYTGVQLTATHVGKVAS